MIADAGRSTAPHLILLGHLLLQLSGTGLPFALLGHRRLHIRDTLLQMGARGIPLGQPPGELGNCLGGLGKFGRLVVEVLFDLRHGLRDFGVLQGGRAMRAGLAVRGRNI